MFSLACWTSVSLDFILCACLSPLGPPLGRVCFGAWTWELTGEGICSPDPSFRWDLVHCHGQPSPLETSEVPRLIPFLHPGINYISSSCTRRWSCYLWTQTSAALFPRMYKCLFCSSPISCTWPVGEQLLCSVKVKTLCCRCDSLAHFSVKHLLCWILFSVSVRALTNVLELETRHDSYYPLWGDNGFGMAGVEGSVS